MTYSFYTTKAFTYDTGEFLERPNRFIALIKYKGKILRCHVPDPGRLKELLVPNVKVLLRFPPVDEQGKTDAGMIGVYVSQSNLWVSTDSQLASRCIRATWKSLPVFKDYTAIKPEFTYGESRIDFLLVKKDAKCLVEVKSVGLKKDDNIGYFPDAPTKRGVRHVKELQKAYQEGYRSVVVFFVSRSDILTVKPNKELDPDFYEAIKRASLAGVEFRAIRFDFTPEGVNFDREIPFTVD